MIPSGRNMQNRIVTREDLLARLFTLPAEFGRVYRASITNTPNNPLASILYVLSRDNAARLVQAPDALKLNLRGADPCRNLVPGTYAAECNRDIWPALRFRETMSSLLICSSETS